MLDYFRFADDEILELLLFYSIDVARDRSRVFYERCLFAELGCYRLQRFKKADDENKNSLSELAKKSDKLTEDVKAIAESLTATRARLHATIRHSSN